MFFEKNYYSETLIPKKVDIKIMEESIRRSNVRCKNLILEPLASSLALLDENDKEDISKFKPLIKLYDRADIINDIA